MKKIVGEAVRAAGILLFSDSESPSHFLLMRHRDRWDLPKGHCEKGESFKQAAIRETEEETGIPATDIELENDFHFDLRYPVTYKRHGDVVFDKHVRYFIGYVTGQPSLTLTEHESAEWFQWKSPPEPVQAETIDPLLAAAAGFLANQRPQ
ncbi:Diadenosine hexaphosphate hydrolase [Rubripirellula tenax]|uniref:Diadenosine hexaphosphate hydrolase n=1 Tax=Rubripirellula tenax TaxID=2528015 RepID=A0A5C6FD18_9BACT|nr:NUDIX domain-containing protein [Rubripirellula tenax]TWU59325.1 Diadenosine hexaphosphate hydrolase [Rubripirellula tenax]